MKCLNCGTEFTALSINQKYCCTTCGARYRWKNRGKLLYPSVTFSCSHCGKTVVTESGSGDMRTRFCSAVCEKKFWRHPHWENTSNRINFRSADEYASYERRTNESW
jgi:DNA-directed RNA polymerase subunit RPC12/RpoP/endogenous inhibitor of DNA gyrase (YacG/DUF329 family)